MAENNDLAPGQPVATLVGFLSPSTRAIVTDAPIVTVDGAPEDSGHYHFVVFTLDVEDIHVAITQEEARLAITLRLGKACDIFERRQMGSRQFRPDARVVSPYLEGKRDVGTFRVEPDGCLGDRPEKFRFHKRRIV